MSRATIYLVMAVWLAVMVGVHAQTVTPTSPREVRIAEGIKLCDQADKLLAEGKAQDALKLYQSALKILPTSPRAKAGVEKAKAPPAAPVAVPAPPAAETVPVLEPPKPPTLPLPQDEFAVPPETQQACPAEALAWPTVMATTLQGRIPWHAFYIYAGQYGGSVKPEGQAGLRVWGSWTDTALWLRQPLSEYWLLTTEVCVKKDDGICFPCFWLSGPGYGNALGMPYSVSMTCSEGSVTGGGRTGKFRMPEGVKEGSYYTLNLLRQGSHFSMWVNGQQIGEFDDATLTGPQYSHIAIGAQGAPEKGVFFRNLRIQALPLTAEQAVSLATPPLLPEATTPPAPNKKLLQELSLDGRSEGWTFPQPQNIYWKHDKAVLVDSAARLLWQTGLTEDFALEVDAQYLPKVFPTPLMLPDNLPDAYLLTGAAEGELQLHVGLGDVAPTGMDGADLPSRWLFIFNSSGNRLVWTGANKQEQKASSPYFGPTNGNRYTLRMEFRRNAIRAFINGRLMFESATTDHPWLPGTKAFTGLDQVYDGIVIHGMRIYSL
ncbi:MAG: hypothetical protein ABFE08_16425 [Armatimonadia bacterium]